MKPLTLPQELRRHSARFWFVVSPSTKLLLERAAARIEELERLHVFAADSAGNR